MKKLFTLLIIFTIGITGFGQVPNVTNLNPNDNATAVATSSDFTLTFDTNIQFNTTTTSHYIYIYENGNPSPIKTYQFAFGFLLGSSEVTYSTNTVTINPSANLTEGTDYYIIIENGAIESTTATPFPGLTLNTDWNFTTYAPPTPPSLTNLSPSDNATGVSIDADFTLTFDIDVQFNTTTTSHYIYIYENGNPSPIKTYQFAYGFLLGSSEVTYSSNTVTINPSANLTEGTDYYIIVENGAIEGTSTTPFSGLTLDTDWNFTTVSAATPPSIITYNPVQDAPNVALTQSLVLTFNEDIVKGSSGRFYIYNSDDTEFESFGITNGNVVASGTTLTVTHTAFSEGASYYVLIDGGFIESSTTGSPFGGISSTTEWAFTSEILPPAISSYTPVDNASGLSLETDLNLSFDENITIGSSGTLYIRLTSDNSLFDSYLTTDPEISVAGNTLHITHANFSSNTEYYVLVDAGFVKSATTDMDFNGISSTTQWSFTTDIYKTWTGGTSDFSSAANWSGSGSSIIIPRTASPQPIVSSSTSINHAIIEAGASLTISSSGDLTVDNSLILKSSADPAIGNANLLNEGTLTTTGATIIAEQYLNRVGVYTSSPVAGATQQSAGISDRLYYRNASIPAWVLMGASDEILAGVGLYAYGNVGETVEFTGTLNNASSYSQTTYRTTSPNNYGWNLIGNPYPCSIDWESISLNNMDNEFYILNNNTGIYGTYNGNGTPVYTDVDPTNPSHIPSCHSFWTQVTIGQSNGSIIIPSTARVNTHYTYLKNTTTSSRQNIRFAGINEENIKNEIVISFTPDATDENDAFDSEKKFSTNNSILQLYTTHSSNNYAIDSYSAINEGKSIQLGYQVGEAGTYRIALKELSNIDENISIQLEDIKIGNYIDMSLNDEYTFSSEAGTFTDRFMVHILPTISTDLNEKIIEKDVNIYSVGNHIYFNIPKINNPVYYIYNTSGKLLQSGNLTSTSLNKIIAIKSGINIVKVVSNEQIYTSKVFIKK